MTILLLALAGDGPQFQLAWIFWVLFAIWVFLGFAWYYPRTGVAPGPWHGWGSHGMITLFIFLLGWGEFGLPGIGR